MLGEGKNPSRSNDFGTWNNIRKRRSVEQWDIIWSVPFLRKKMRKYLPLLSPFYTAHHHVVPTWIPRPVTTSFINRFVATAISLIRKDGMTQPYLYLQSKQPTHPNTYASFSLYHLLNECLVVAEQHYFSCWGDEVRELFSFHYFSFQNELRSKLHDAPKVSISSWLAEST